MGRALRIAQQQVFGDDAGLLRFAGLEIRLGQLLLRGRQRGVEVAVDAHLDQAEQRRQVAAAPSRGTPAAAAPPCEVAGRGGVIDQQVDDRVARVGRRQVLAEGRDLFDRLGSGGEEAHQQFARLVEVVELEQDLAAGQQQLRILRRGWCPAGSAWRAATSSRPSAALARRSDTSVAPGSRLTTSSSSARPRSARLRESSSLASASSSAVTVLPVRTRIAGGLEARLEVGRVELGQADDQRVGAVLVAAALALVDGRLQVRLGVGQLALLRAGFDQLQQGAFVLRVELEDLPVAGGGLGGHAFLQQVIADPHELRDRLGGLPGSTVEVAQGPGGRNVVREGLDDVLVLRNGAIEPPLSEQLLGLAQRVVPVDGHWSLSQIPVAAGHPMVSNSVGV